MNDIKGVVAKNIADLRQANGLTQLELAARLNYSDKAVSKWERGDSLPDVSVLLEIADMFSVPLDYLVRAEHEVPPPAVTHRYDRRVITGLSVLLVWFAAVLAFVVTTLSGAVCGWLAFVYAVPASLVVWLILNSIWLEKRWNYLIISLLMWSVLAALHVTLLLCGVNIWLAYLLGIPGQIIILLWSAMKRRPKNK